MQDFLPQAQQSLSSLPARGFLSIAVVNLLTLHPAVARIPLILWDQRHKRKSEKPAAAAVKTQGPPRSKKSQGPALSSQPGSGLAPADQSSKGGPGKGISQPDKAVPAHSLLSILISVSGRTLHPRDARV